MSNFNLYIEQLDYNPIIDLIKENGEECTLKKREYFVRQNDPCKFVGFVESGILRYTRINNDGNEHIVGYSFTKDFVCDYPSLIKRSGSLTNIQAVTNCSVYVISMKKLNDYWETNMDTQRLGRLVAEEHFFEIYGRLLDFYCDTAEQRYTSLLTRCPNLPQYIPLKEIASFLGVTPETVSHIRKKLLDKYKS